MLRAERGMSLVEVLVAFGLLALAATLAFQVLATTRRSHAQSEARTAAAFLGRSLLDEARAADFETLANREGTSTLTALRDGRQVSTRYDFTLAVQPAGADLKRVWATVTWREGSSQPTQVVETFIFRH